MKRLDLMYMIGLKIGGKVKLSLFTNNRILYIENPKGNTHTHTHTHELLELRRKKETQQDLRMQDQYTKINCISMY